ncbi:cytochrome P450 [Aspergillus sclerotioniger CBS 115572]|uniref:Cytochrome P450 n=1 Tax=Aspergillus sclerotioniger CBS 115572 TaxID=1450535 RepID=A0A317UTJ5_9EURO|nr:cytochrome P450 [Aspergillus sclerotioniger CBS 115572]PWY64781.1 cytochrome P450 [Aspergillus sclerotioniger CBS 115572]
MFNFIPSIDLTPFTILLTLTLLSLLLLTHHTITTLHTHPLNKYPGPLHWRLFDLPSLLSLTLGHLPHDLHTLHKHHGPVIRTSPTSLSFTSPLAWNDIYTRDRLFLRPPQLKDQPPGKTALNLIACSEEEHARLRRVLAQGFAAKAVRAQEGVVGGLIDVFEGKIDERIDGGGGKGYVDVDVVEWVNYLSFDVIGKVTWGRSFGCLDGLRYGSWIQTVRQFKAAVVVGALKYYPFLYWVVMRITPPGVLRGVMEMWRVTGERGMSVEEMEVNSMLIVAAGSESITTVITGTVNYLLREPEKMRRLVEEIRGRFGTEEEITGTRVKGLPYLDAVLSEGMRLCPTIPDGMRRLVPEGGAVVAGEFLPGGTTVSVCQWASYRDERNFCFPDEFAPERWLEEEGGKRFEGDVKSVFNPFSLGAHNCPGQNLAWLELRLILARLLWRYDLSIPPGVELPRWEEQGIWWFWDKKPTLVRFSRFR